MRVISWNKKVIAFEKRSRVFNKHSLKNKSSKTYARKMSQRIKVNK